MPREQEQVTERVCKLCGKREYQIRWLMDTCEHELVEMPPIRIRSGEELDGIDGYAD